MRGSVIYFGKYELLSRINIGGMAEIVKARDATPTGDRLVAIKRILPHLCDDEQFKAMFLDESRVLGQLDHASIIQTFEIGEIEDTPYIALEYVDGQDARTLFEESHNQQRRMPVGVACYIVARVCEGLHHAHEQTDANGESLGIVHRDVSLQNILLSYEGDVKLTDFGIAVSAENVARTDVGVVKGKFGYMSPEQIKSAPLDRRSDIFAAGICLYELLTSERLFSGESDYKAVERVRNVDVEPPSTMNRQIPSSLERIVMKALAKHPRDRYQSANDMRRALQAFLADSNEFVGQEDLAAYMKDVFATELATGRGARIGTSERVTVSVAQPMPPEPITGLSAFDDVEPVSSMRALDAPVDRAEHADRGSGMLSLPGVTPGFSAREALRGRGPAPSVPPIVPRAESIPASNSRAPYAPRAPSAYGAASGQRQRFDTLIGAAPPFGSVPIPGQRFDMDWDEEEPTTVSQGFQDPPSAPVATAAPVVEAHDPFAAHGPHDPEDEEVTRVALPEETARGLAALRGETPQYGATPSYRARSMPTLSVPRPRSTPGPMLIAGVLAAAVVVLGVYLLRGRGTATLRLETEPRDAIATVDGQRAASPLSPFVFPELPAGVSHSVVVEKTGYTGWSTKLRVRRDKTFDLPLVKLSPVQQAPLVAREPASPPVPLAAATPISRLPSTQTPSPRHPPTEARPAHVTPAPSHLQHKMQAPPTTHAAVAENHIAAPPASPAPLAANGGGGGTLRVNTRPWSKVSVDGRPIGNTPQMNLQLKAGTHTVTLSNDQFGVTKTFVVSIKPNETVTRVLTLLP